MNKSFEEWQEITSHGTSGDQVADIMASWAADRHEQRGRYNALKLIGDQMMVDVSAILRMPDVLPPGYVLKLKNFQERWRRHP